MADEKRKLLANNKKARFNYTIEDSMECGIELKGTEVKSIKSGKCSFTDSYGRIMNGELWFIGFHITPYPFGNLFNHEPTRNRKLLVHKQEIKRLKRQVEEKGRTLIPLKMYLKKGLVKLELGICVGKKLHDKRQSIKNRDEKRTAEREYKQRI